jgi:hypothetical protein
MPKLEPAWSHRLMWINREARPCATIRNGSHFHGASDMKRRHFVLGVAGAAILAGCSADAADAVVVYKDAA